MESTRDSLELPARAISGGGLSRPARCCFGGLVEVTSDVLPLRRLDSILTGDERRKDIDFCSLELKLKVLAILE
jgi:hypothetical protein